MVVFVVLGYSHLGEPAAPLLAAFGLVSLMLAFGNLMPYWNLNGTRTDGAYLIDVARGRWGGREERALILVGLAFDGVPFKDWDTALVHRIDEETADGSGSAWIYVTIKGYYLATADVDRALALVERLVSGLDRVSDDLKIDLAFLVALVRRQGARSLELLESVDSIRSNDYGYWRAYVTALDAEGQSAAVIEAIKQARLVAEKTSARLDDDDWNLLDSLEQRAKAALNGG